MKINLSRRQALFDGLRLNIVYRFFALGIQFALMLVLVRILSPEDYGQAGVVTGLLAVLNVFCVPGFMKQALQLPDGVEPDWSSHFSAGFYIQLTVSLVAHFAAGICWLFESHRPIAPLLHIAALAILLDWPNALGGTMCLREMNFPRMRLVEGAGMLVRQAITLILALAGTGAFAIVIGASVGSLPFMLDLFFVRKWRPPPGWWHWPDWGAYRPALKFGFANIGAGLLQSGQGALAAVILPATLGYTSIGFWGRAQGLFTMTLGQFQAVLFEMAQPLLPRYATDAERFARVATYFTRVMLLVMVPGGLFLALESTTISRVLYGEKWAGADSLLWPGILAGLGAVIFNMGSVMFLALNRLRIWLTLSVVWAVSTFSVLLVPIWGGDITAYAWAVAIAQMLAGAAVLGYAGRLLELHWLGKVLGPPVIAAAGAAAAVMGAHVWLAELALAGRLASSAALFGLVLLTVLRVVFPDSLADLFLQIPGGQRINRWLGFRETGPRF